MKKTSILIILLIIIAFVGCEKRVFDEPDIIEIALNGESEVVVNYGSSYIDEGAFATENSNDVSDLVETTSNLDVEMLGSYTIEYSYKDKTVTRNIEVCDTAPPKITLIGNPVLYIPTDEEYVDKGCKAIDNYDQDLTQAIVIKSNVDTSNQGDYFVEYSVTDSSGNTAVIEREVNVVKSPLAFSLEDFTLEGLFEETIIKETILDDIALQNYLADTYFIGDSRNCWFLWKGCVPKTHVWGQKSLDPLNIDRLKIERFDTGEKATAITLIEKYKPKRIIFTLGVDCVGAIKPEVIVEHYTAFLQEVEKASPKTQIIVHNIMPVDGYMDTEDERPWAPDNKKINDANYFLVKMCEDLNIKFLYTGHLLKDENGLGIGKYFVKDYIHLTKEAQWIIYDYITKHPLIEDAY